MQVNHWLPLLLARVPPEQLLPRPIDRAVPGGWIPPACLNSNQHTHNSSNLDPIPNEVANSALRG